MRLYRRLLLVATLIAFAVIALGAYVLLAAYMYWDARRTNGEA